MGMVSAIFDLCLFSGFAYNWRHFVGARSSKVIAQPGLGFVRFFIFVFLGRARTVQKYLKLVWGRKLK